LCSLYRHFEEGASVLILFELAEKLEVYAGNRARRAIDALIELKPDTAIIRRSSGEAVVPVGDVSLGEIFVVRPGIDCL